MRMMTLDEVETEIYNYYQWFAKNAPGVTAVETGELGSLWAIFDEMVDR